MLRRNIRLTKDLNRYFSSEKKDSTVPILRVHDAVRKTMEDVLGETKEKKPIEMTTDIQEAASNLSGIPEEHKAERIAKIYKPTRQVTQTPWNNTKVWNIALDNRERWENPLIGWASSGDPLSSIDMALDFATKEDAIAFCEKNHWKWEVEEPQSRKVIPKQYGANFSWNKKIRVTTK
uniref:NADH dehydrogenase [ubiquinone] iron-sulfur protein 4, mitochondrial n=1 Tax=Panagrolaimus sp. JU765 TaxID=591449 RepID=A0AC34R6V3_9BILA